MTYFKNYLYLSLFLLFISSINTTFISAQVTSVNYFLKYDNLNNYVDFSIIIDQGSTTETVHRIQGNAQITIIAPTGTTLTVDSLFMPLQHNLFYDGEEPTKWEMKQGFISPAAQPENDFYSITPKLSPVSSYNDLFEGDTVRLFRLGVNNACASDIRLFQNGIDPAPWDPGMAGADFSQNFTMGGANQLYDTNTTNQGYLAQIHGETTVCRGEFFTLYTDSIPNAIYSWTDINGIVYPNEPQITVTSAQFEGIDTAFFTLSITKDDICAAPNNTQYVVIHDVPNISIDGPDSICIGNTTQLLPVTGGTWASDNLEIATIDNSGIVTGVATGSTSFTFTDTITGCETITNLNIEVLDASDPLCISANDDLEKELISIYPNPTIDILHISGISKYDRIWITSITGKKIDVNVQYKNNRVIINTSEIVPGVYFVCIHTSENLVAKKMIKM